MASNPDSKLNHFASSALVSSALFASLVAKLGETGVISARDAHDIYDRALLSLERIAADMPDKSFASIYADARTVIDDALQSVGSPDRFD